VKAMILAAGLGTRLRPVTDKIAKPAVPFFGRPILLRTLDLLAEIGVTEAIVNSHYRPDDVARLLAKSPIPATLSHEPEILGTGGGLARVREKFRGEEAFLLINGDVIFELPLGEAFVAHRASEALGTLLLLRNPDPSRYGIIVAPEGFHSGCAGDPLRRVDRILPPAASGEGFLYAGAAIFSGSVLDRLPEGRSELVPALLGPLSSEGALAGYLSDGIWYELGTPGDLLQAHLDLLRRMLAGRMDSLPLARRIVGNPMRFDRELRSAIHPTARIDGLVDEIIADEGCVVGEAVELRRSLLLPGARVGGDTTLADRVITRE